MAVMVMAICDGSDWMIQFLFFGDVFMVISLSLS